MHHRSAFTLIELLVVIAIIAVLAVVVVLTLNPAQLIQQSRDSGRLSDLANIETAVNLFTTDQPGASLGNASSVYVSIPDPTATTTLGDQCQGLGLLSLPLGWTYHCAASSTVRNADGTGWIPVNLKSISVGSPLSSLPQDPIAETSTGLYYTYTTNGTQYEVTAAMESQKYGLAGSNDVVSTDDGTNAYLLEKGTNLALEPIDYGQPSGLVGYWPLDEGTGTIAYDYSGNGLNGSWSGTNSGTNGYYDSGTFGLYTGHFNGSNNYISLGSSTLLNPATFTILARTNLATTTGGMFYSDTNCCSGKGINFSHSGILGGQIYNGSSQVLANGSSHLATGSWQQVAFTYDGATAKYYLNGVLDTATPYSGGVGQPADHGVYIGALAEYLNSSDAWGDLDNVRLYNRALSAAQIAAMYNGGK